jgi:hypothetical protein
MKFVMQVDFSPPIELGLVFYYRIRVYRRFQLMLVSALSTLKLHNLLRVLGEEIRSDNPMTHLLIEFWFVDKQKHVRLICCESAVM